MRPLTLLLFSLFLILAACAPEPQPSSEPLPGEDPPEPAAPTQPAAFDGAMATVTAAPEGNERTNVLQDIRAAAHEGYNRIVFAYDGTGKPGYEVGYVTPPVRACGSGQPVEVAGSAMLSVRMHPARAHTEAGGMSIDATALQPGLPVLEAAERTCDFEGQVTWVLGLSEKRPFRVQRLTDPPRIVVDIQHAEPGGRP